jgi:Rrf2 family protein
MKLSKRGIYALRVLRHLAAHHGEGAISSAHLARVERVPKKYLEQILTLLSKRGLLISERGKEGGYRLRKPPDEVTLGDVIRMVDGPLAPIPCASRTMPTEDPDCPYTRDTCWMRLLMLRVRDSISEILDKETLAMMAESARSSTFKDEADDAEGDDSSETPTSDEPEAVEAVASVHSG